MSEALGLLRHYCAWLPGVGPGSRGSSQVSRRGGIEDRVGQQAHHDAAGIAH